MERAQDIDRPEEREVAREHAMRSMGGAARARGAPTLVAPPGRVLPQTRHLSERRRRVLVRRTMPHGPSEAATAPTTDDTADFVPPPMLRYVDARAVWAYSSSALLCFLFIISLLIGITLATASPLSLTLNTEEGCDRPLAVWLVVLLGFNTLMAVTACAELFLMPREMTDWSLENPTTVAACELNICQRICNIVWFLWVVVGLQWVPSATCGEEGQIIHDIAVVVAILHAVFFALVCCCCCGTIGIWMNRAASAGFGEPAPRGASRKAIRSLEKRKFAEGMLDEEDATCSICLTEYETGEPLRILPCEHHFHSECVDVWLRKNRSCPLCKHQINEGIPEFLLERRATEEANLHAARRLEEGDYDTDDDGSSSRSWLDDD